MSVAPSTNIVYQRPASVSPRYILEGGYVLGPKHVLEWGERLSGESLTEEDLIYTHNFIIPLVEAHGAQFTMVGEVSKKLWMVVTQSRKFNGWKGMDPSLIPQFKEGAQEVRARELLVKQGVTEFEFRMFLG